MKTALLLSFLSLATVWHLAVGGPLPPFNLKTQDNLVGLTAQQLDKLPKQYMFGTDSRTPKLSWTVRHTGLLSRQAYFNISVGAMIN